VTGFPERHWLVAAKHHHPAPNDQPERPPLPRRARPPRASTNPRREITRTADPNGSPRQTIYHGRVPAPRRSIRPGSSAGIDSTEKLATPGHSPASTSNERHRGLPRKHPGGPTAVGVNINHSSPQQPAASNANFSLSRRCAGGCQKRENSRKGWINRSPLRTRRMICQRRLGAGFRPCVRCFSQRCFFTGLGVSPQG